MKRKGKYLQGNECPHGHLLGAGCTECPKSEKKESEIRYCLGALAVLINLQAKSILGRVERRRGQRDVEALLNMRARYS